MGSILKRQRKDGKSIYLAQVRRAGHPPQSESFETHLEARRWMTKVEAEFDASAQQQTTKPAQSIPTATPLNRPGRKTDRKPADTGEMASKAETKGRSKARERRRVHHLIDRYVKEILPQKASQEFPKTALAWWKSRH
jgi:hypothetical protein